MGRLLLLPIFWLAFRARSIGYALRGLCEAAHLSISKRKKSGTYWVTLQGNPALTELLIF
nr:hypothetical protein Q903MT_gene1238 [Picea sitchensis]